MFEAYKIGVTLSLTNHVSRGLALMARDFAKTEEQVAILQKRISSIQSQALKGGLMVGAGVGMLALMKGPYEDAKKLAQAKADFETLNLSVADNQMAYAKAASMSQTLLGTNITENLKGIHDLHTAFGDLHHAIRSADDFAKFGFTAKVMNNGAPVEGLVYNAAKALEHRGQKVMGDDSSFKQELDLMERVYLGSRGKVNPGEFFHASQTGKMAYTLMDKDELYGAFAAYMQSKSGTTAGTAAMTFSSSLIGGHMTNKAKGFLADLGLWDEHVSKARVGMLAQLTNGMTPAERKAMGLITPTSGGLKEQFLDLAVHHQSEFVQTVLAPAIRKRFGMDMSDEAVATMLMANFNRGTSDFMGEYIVNALKFKKDAAIFQKSMGIGEAYQHYLKSPEGAEIAAGEAWRNLLTVIGSVYLPTITNGLLSLAGSLTRLSKWTDDHPDITKGLVVSFAALAGALTFGGTVILLSAAFRGLGLALMFKGPGGVKALSVAIEALASPIGIAVMALGTLVAAAYAFRPFTKDEINAQRANGAHLTAGAKERAKALNWASEDKITSTVIRQKNLADSSLLSNMATHGPVMGITHYIADKARLAFGSKPDTDFTSGKPASPQTSPYIAGGVKKPVQIVNNTYLDGRLISQNVIERMVNESMRPASGLTGVDPRMGFMSPSMAR